MKVERVIDWLGRLTAGHLPREARTERVLHTDRVIEVAKMLHEDQYELVRLHDIEGCSIEALHDATGLPDDTIRENVEMFREEVCELLRSRDDSKHVQEPTEIVL